MLRVKIEDWDGIYGWYEVILLQKKDESRYKVSFVNSRKDTEHVTVDIKDLVITG